MILAAKLKSADRDRVFAQMLRQNGFAEPARELRFAKPIRQWRFDYAWPREKVALEVEGGAWVRGRHTRGAGFLEDMDKYNRAVLLGWRVLRVTPDQLVSAETCALLEQVLPRSISDSLSP